MKKRWFCDVRLFRRRWPYFAIGLDEKEFHLYLWIIEIDVYRGY